MAKNRRPSNDDSDDYEVSQSKRSKSIPKRAPPLYKATVTETADSTFVRVRSITADLDESMLVRMKKCLARANHPETPEAEAKAALRIASKLMNMYNVTQAEVLEHETPEDQRKYAGSSVVTIQRRDEDKSKKVLQSNYTSNLCKAMRKFFGCQFYTTSGQTLKITFYGIAENTVAASSAFEIVYNLIVEWARPYKGQSGKNSYCYGVADELLRTADREKIEEERRAKQAEEDARAARMKQEQADDQARLDRLHELQERVEDEEEAKPFDESAKIAEPAKTPQPMNATRTITNSALRQIHEMYASSDEHEDSDNGDGYEEWNGFSDDEDEEPNESGIDYVAADFSDDDDDEDDDEDDGEKLLRAERLLRAEDIEKTIKDLASTIKTDTDPDREAEVDTTLPFRFADSSAAENGFTEPRRDSVRDAGDANEDPAWTSHMQLIKFRETTEKIAQDWLKDQGTKLRKPRKRTGVKDWDAFRKGQKDGKKIDVRKKTIADHSKDESEKASDLLSVMS